MFENLSEKLEKAFKVLKGQGSISEINVAQTMKEIRKALLAADVDFKTAKQFTASVKEKALGQQVLTAVEPGQLLTTIMRDELAELMGSSKSEINLDGNPTVILIAGLQGSGKTTFTGKLALHLKTKLNKIIVVMLLPSIKARAGQEPKRGFRMDRNIHRTGQRNSGPAPYLKG